VQPHDLLGDDGRRVETTFREADGQTVVTESFDPDPDAPREMQQAGWQAILDRFAVVAADRGRQMPSSFLRAAIKTSTRALGRGWSTANFKAPLDHL